MNTKLNSEIEIDSIMLRWVCIFFELYVVIGHYTSKIEFEMCRRRANTISTHFRDLGLKSHIQISKHSQEFCGIISLLLAL